MRLTLLLALVAAAPVSAGPVRLKGGAKAEEKLRRFVSLDARLNARIKDAVRREERFVAETLESDLRDAVSDTSIDDLHANLEKTTDEKRKTVLERLPGMKALSGPACATLTDCPNPDMSIEVCDARNLPDCLRLMVRPWMTLQQARESEIAVAAAEGDGDAALTVSLKGVSAQPLVLNVSPRLIGGFRVWFDQPEAAAELYARERAAVLKASP
ncbi:MAG: hypothetical protein AAB268_06670 [Elusimicrobiota bacterium]